MVRESEMLCLKITYRNLRRLLRYITNSKIILYRSVTVSHSKHCCSVRLTGPLLTDVVFDLCTSVYLKAIHVFSIRHAIQIFKPLNHHLYITKIAITKKIGTFI